MKEISSKINLEATNLPRRKIKLINEFIYNVIQKNEKEKDRKE